MAERQGVTTQANGHVHTFEVDTDGNGLAREANGHTHLIIGFQVSFNDGHTHELI